MIFPIASSWWMRGLWSSRFKSASADELESQTSKSSRLCSRGCYLGASSSAATNTIVTTTSVEVNSGRERLIDLLTGQSKGRLACSPSIIQSILAYM